MSDHIDSDLWDAVYDGDVALVSELIAQGATVDSRSVGSTALHKAAYFGDTPVVICLLEAGWSREARTNGGETPLALAAVGGNPETVNYLLNKGANIDTQDGYGYTPLHRASLSGRTEVIKTLLNRGADQTIRDNFGATAKDQAKNNQTRAAFRAEE